MGAYGMFSTAKRLQDSAQAAFADYGAPRFPGPASYQSPITNHFSPFPAFPAFPALPALPAFRAHQIFQSARAC
jgi:hypothetical protein